MGEDGRGWDVLGECWGSAGGVLGEGAEPVGLTNLGIL